MKKHRVRTGALLAASALFLFAACTKNDAITSKEPGPNQNKLSVYLTDGPAYFDQVLVDIQSIAVKVDTAQDWWSKKDDDEDEGNWKHHKSVWGNEDEHDQAAVWDTLDIKPGIYDLLSFANGADTLLSSDVVPKGRIIAFRLRLGEENSLVKDSTEYPLQLITGWNNIYIRVFGANFEKVNTNHYKIWIDFDAGRSIIRVRDGMFYLKPVLHAFAVSNTGSIRGVVLPDEAFPVVSVYNNTDTSYAIAGRGGAFMVRGLQEGTYSVFINASNGYQDTTLSDISVEAGKQADVGNITLHQ